MRYDLGVSGSGEGVAFPLEFLAQVVGIDNVAVMCQRYLAGRAGHQYRLRIEPAARPCRGIAVVPYGDTAPQLVQYRLGEYLRYQPHSCMQAYLASIGCSDARALLPAMLQGKKRKKGKAGYILIGGIDTENTARLVQDYLPLKPVLTDSAI